MSEMKHREDTAMKLNTMEYFIHETFLSLKRNSWMTLASIGTVAVALFVFGMFLVIVMNTNRMADSLESQVEISVYLKDDISQSKIEDIGNKLREMQGLESVEYVSKERAIEDFRERLGEQSYILTALGSDNPLPNAYKVKAKVPSLVATAAKVIRQIDGVEEARYGQDVMKHLFDITRLARIIGVSIMAVLVGATLFIIYNTIRLTVFARRREVAIMKYVGATDRFIRWPFIMEGIVLGAVGGVIATVFLFVAYRFVARSIIDALTFFPLIPESPFMYTVGFVVIVSGICMGALGSALSLKRFLKA